MRERKDPESCGNEGCRRPAARRESFCEACGIERSLFRRDERFESSRQAVPAPPRGLESVSR